MLYQILQQIPDFRRAQGKRYKLAPILYICIWATLSNATSYRKLHIYFVTHFKFFKKELKLSWKKPPSLSTIRECVVNTNINKLEQAFRLHAQELLDQTTGKLLSIDGKTIRGSFDHTNNSPAIHILMAFLVEDKLILGHKNVTEDKTNEIPKLQELIDELKIAPKIITLDALHCQKKRYKRLFLKTTK